MNMQGYQCLTCGEFHAGLPFSYGPPAPALWFTIPENERNDRVLLSPDQCIIDDKYFFVLGRLEIPVIDGNEIFSWLVWVSLSETNFDRMSELWESEGRDNEPPYFGRLGTDLPCYDEGTSNLKTKVHTRPIGQRPFIELAATDHPLAIEQRLGITMERVQRIAECVMHS
jgi:hypothetical protein